MCHYVTPPTTPCEPKSCNQGNQAAHMNTAISCWPWIHNDTNLTTKEHAEAGGTIWNTFGSQEVFSCRAFPRWVSFSVPTESSPTWPTKVEEQVQISASAMPLANPFKIVSQEEGVSNCEWNLFLLAGLISRLWYYDVVRFVRT